MKIIDTMLDLKLLIQLIKNLAYQNKNQNLKDCLTTGNVGDQKIYAIKPLTFMNNSGICIRELIEYFKIDAEDVIVFHDDLDVDLEKLKQNLVDQAQVIMELHQLINLLVKITQE